MKTKRTLGITALVLVAFALGYGLGTWRTPPPPRRISAVNQLRQVGLEFRQFRNDMTLHGVTGALVTPSSEPTK